MAVATLTINVVHVYPLHDLREHVTDGAACWCRPQVEDDEDDRFGVVVVHNSLDGREAFARGERKPS